MIQINDKFAGLENLKERACKLMKNAPGTLYSNFATNEDISRWFRTVTFASNLVRLRRKNNGHSCRSVLTTCWADYFVPHSSVVVQCNEFEYRITLLWRFRYYCFIRPSGIFCAWQNCEYFFAWCGKHTYDWIPTHSLTPHDSCSGRRVFRFWQMLQNLRRRNSDQNLH